jgi:hypothetical protein
MVVGIVLFYINYTDGFGPVIDAQEVVNTTNKSEDQKFIPSKEFEATCTDDDFAIAGISIIKSTPNGVLSVFGEPLAKEIGVIKADNHSAKDDLWRYREFDIYIAGDYIFRIEVFQGEYQTVRGIKIGDPVEKVIEKYGIHDEFSKSYHDNFKPGDNYYEYSKEGNYIGFMIKNRKVASILIYYQT